MSVAEIWSTVAPPGDRVEAHPRHRDEIDIERTLEAFKEGVAKQISADDVDSHTNLAEAYREMGLYVDALREAAIAVTAAVVPRSAEAAVGFLLAPPLLTPNGLERLRERLLANGLACGDPQHDVVIASLYGASSTSHMA